MHKCLTGSEKDSLRRTMPPGEMNASITSTRPTMAQPKKDCKSRLQWSVESLLSDTSNQGTLPSRGHKILSPKNAYIIYVSNVSIEGTPLFSGKGPFFWVYFNPRLATWAEMSLSQAQNIFMPATTINT